MRRSLEVEVELTVGKGGRQNLANLKRKRRLADSAHPVQSGDRDSAFADLGDQFFDLGLATDEVHRNRRKLARSLSLPAFLARLPVQVRPERELAEHHQPAGQATASSRAESPPAAGVSEVEDRP